MIGAAMPDDRSAGVVSPVGLSLFLASGGFFVNTNSVPALFRLLNHANLFVYGFGALAVNEFSGLALHCDASELVGPPPLPPPQRAIARLVGVRWPDPRCPVERGERRCSRRWRSTASRPRRIWRRSARSSSRTASSASSPSAAASDPAGGEPWPCHTRF